MKNAPARQGQEREEERDIDRLIEAAAKKSGKTVEELLSYYEEINPEYAKQLRRVLNEEDHRKTTEETVDSSRT